MKSYAVCTFIAGVSVLFDLKNYVWKVAFRLLN